MNKRKRNDEVRTALRIATRSMDVLERVEFAASHGRHAHLRRLLVELLLLANEVLGEGEPPKAQPQLVGLVAWQVHERFPVPGHGGHLQLTHLSAVGRLELVLAHLQTAFNKWQSKMTIRRRLQKTNGAVLSQRPEVRHTLIATTSFVMLPMISIRS